MSKWKDVLNIVNGRNQKKVENSSGKYPIYGSGGVIGYADKFICPANTIVIGRKGNINKPICVQEPFWNVDTAFGLVPNSNLLHYKYLFYFCINYNFNKLNTTVTIPSLTKANLLNIEIKIPTLEEQHKIASILDTVSEALKLRKQQLNELDLLVKSKFVDMFGDPVENPKSWSIDLLKNYLSVISGYAFDSTGFLNNGIPILKIGNINSGYFKPTNLVFWNFDKLLSKYMIYPGDLVISLTGTVGKEDYGNVCIIDDSFPIYYLNQRNAKLELHSNINKFYLVYIFKTPKIKNQIIGINRGIRQANISNKDILNLSIPVPPIELQNKFASFVHHVDELKSEVQKSIDQLQTLFDSLMQQYFE